MATDTPLALALDVGTSSCRAGLYDKAGHLVSGTGTRLGYTPNLTGDGGADVDADVLLGLVANAIDGTLRQGEASSGAIAAVGVSAFWHSLLGLGEDGRPLTPVYLWMDARSRDESAWLRAHLDERAVHARTGCVLHWTYWPAKLRWVRKQHPDTYRRVRRWVSFGEYLTERFFGEPLVSVSMASGTGL